MDFLINFNLILLNGTSFMVARFHQQCALLFQYQIYADSAFTCYNSWADQFQVGTLFWFITLPFIISISIWTILIQNVSWKWVCFVKWALQIISNNYTNKNKGVNISAEIMPMGLPLLGSNKSFGTYRSLENAILSEHATAATLNINTDGLNNIFSPQGQTSLKTIDNYIYRHYSSFYPFIFEFGYEVTFLQGKPKVYI